LSKAFGVYGGAILGGASLRQRIVEQSRAFMGCTPMPLPLAHAALQAVKLLERGATLRDRLRRNALAVKVALCAGGFDVPDFPGPIVAIHPRSAAQAQKLRKALLAAGIYPPFLRYGGPRPGYFRFVISSEHTRAHLELLTNTLAGLS
jgi:7-keto-8-aminopelargonate synthetase-like enzyme